MSEKARNSLRNALFFAWSEFHYNSLKIAIEDGEVFSEEYSKFVCDSFEKKVHDIEKDPDAKELIPFAREQVLREVRWDEEMEGTVFVQFYNIVLRWSVELNYPKPKEIQELEPGLRELAMKALMRVERDTSDIEIQNTSLESLWTDFLSGFKTNDIAFSARQLVKILTLVRRESIDDIDFKDVAE